MDQTSIGAALDPGARPDPDAGLWAAFATAGTTEALCRTWLALQCRGLADVDGAMLLLARGGTFQPVAMWPDAGQDLGFLREAAEQCVKTGAPVVLRPPHAGGAQGVHVAYPFLGDGDQSAGVVVLDLRARPEEAVRRTLRSLHWGVGWLEAQAVRDRMARERQRVAAAAAALDLVAVANEHDRAEAAATAVANELVNRLGATRVAVGLDAGRGARLVALSHTAWFKRRTTMVRAMESAMDEAIDQRATIRLPSTAGDTVRIQVAHEALRATWQAGSQAEGSIVSFPLLTDRQPVGAVVVLHPDMPGDGILRLGEAVCALLGPILDSKRRARRMVSGRLADAVRDGMGAVIGPRHIGWKLAAAAATAAVAAAVLVPADFRVSAKAVLEGQVQRAVPAPFEGFIATAPVHAGDLVQAGDVLATLDDKDLQLDRVKWDAERQRLTLKMREATAKHDPASIGQLEAQLRQTQAEADLTAAKLARTTLLAPVDGIVVSGDLSHSIGAPVELGKVLFEVAPLDAYRVNVSVDEHDLRDLKPGQAGKLLLHGMSGHTVRFIVRRVTSVAEIDAGRNIFRVEGVVDGAPEGLRPGMEGVAKIVVGKQSYAYIWLHSLIDRARMLIWTWTP